MCSKNKHVVAYISSLYHRCSSSHVFEAESYTDASDKVLQMCKRNENLSIIMFELIKLKLLVFRKGCKVQIFSAFGFVGAFDR